MTQYIDKNALVAEIKRRKERNEKWRDSCKSTDYLVASYVIQEDINILSFINTLEVKEIDLKKEYEEFVVDDPILGNFITNDTMGMELAKHFFELGLKAQKEYKV